MTSRPALGAHRRTVQSFPQGAGRLEFLADLWARFAEDAITIGQQLEAHGWSRPAILEVLEGQRDYFLTKLTDALEMGTEVWAVAS
jgi:hypothetical protein